MIRDQMHWHPYDFLQSEAYKQSYAGRTSVYRTLSVDAFRLICERLCSITRKHSSLEIVFEYSDIDEIVDILSGILSPARMGTYGKSACKRICMFLRWMIRRDKPDLGLWTSWSPSELYAVLDTHVLQLTRSLLSHRGASWAACKELTSVFRSWDAQDPLRYDVALMCYADTLKQNPQNMFYNISKNL